MKKLCLLLAAFLLLTGCRTEKETDMADDTLAVVVQPAEVTDVVYVSIGDSIARGYGLQYVSEERFSTIAGEYLEDAGLSAVVYNYGVDGQTSDELITYIQNGNVPELTEADLVTVSIGANNILRYGSQFLYDYYLYLYSDPAQYTDKEIGERFRQFTADADAGVEQLAADIPVLLAQIRDINPDCQIQFLTLYNPYASLQTTMVINGLPVGLAALTDTYVTRINDCVREGAAGAKDENIAVVDVYGAFAGREAELVVASQPADADPTELDISGIDPHPTKKGHAVIGRLVADSFSGK